MPPPNTLQRMVERQRETNTPIDATPMNLIEKLISTNEGWLTRKGTEYANAGAALFTQWMSAHGIVTDGQANAIFIANIVVAAIHLGLSKMAAPIAAK